MKRNFSVFNSQPNLVNLFNFVQKKNYSSLIISSSLRMSISFLTHGSMTSPLCVSSKQMRISELLEELAIVGESGLENSRYNFYYLVSSEC